MTKIFYLMVDLFNKFYKLEMKICAKEARRLKSKTEFRRLMEKIKKRFWTSWRSTKSTDIWRSGGWFGRRICKVGEGAQSGKFTILLVFLRKRRRWAFSFVKQYAGSTNIQKILRFNIPTNGVWAVFLLKKTARWQPFLAVVRCLFHNHLRLKRSSLLNVYF